MSEKTVTLVNIEKYPVGPLDISYLYRKKMRTVQVFKGTPLRGVPSVVLVSDDAEKAITAKKMTYVEDREVENVAIIDTDTGTGQQQAQVENSTPAYASKNKHNKGKNSKKK